jgi:AraC-like DNA-binding protein
MQFYSQNNLLLSKPAGILPAGFIQPFSIIFSLFYCIYSLIYIKQFLKNQDKLFLESNRVVLRWIKIVCVTITIFIVFQGTQYLTILIGGYFNYISQICQSLSLIYMKGFLLVTPEVIENMDGCIEKSTLFTSSESNNILPDFIGSSVNDTFSASIIRYLSQEKKYLLDDFNITKMASDLGVNKQKLSKQIQEDYQVSFTELINRYRLNHFIELSKENTNLKMDVLIKKSGFAQRSTFYLAFKKYTGSNPSVFLKSLQ